MDFDKFLGEMQKMITATQQGTLFGNKDAQAKAAADVCVDYLKGRGYSVGKPHNYPFKITKPDELISQFYWLVRKNFTNYLWSESNNKKDRVIAKALIESRMKKAGIDRQTAMNQCALIIDIIFKRNDIFKFTEPPSFGILGQGEMSWVTERAVKLLNEAVTKHNNTAAERSAEVLDKEIEKNFPKLGYNLSELEALKEKLEAQYGKKEEK